MRDSCRNRGVDRDADDVLKNNTDGWTCDLVKRDNAVGNLISGLGPGRR